MKSNIRALVFLLLSAFSGLSPAQALAATVKWIDPPPMSVVTASRVTVSGFASEPLPAGARALVKQPGKQEPLQETEAKVQEGQLFRLDLELAPGRNNVVFSDSVYSLYYLADASASTRDPEFANFKTAYPHLPEGGVCARCHGVFQKELTLNAEIADLCARCHAKTVERMKPERSRGHHEKKLTLYCIACHTPHASPAKGLLKDKGNLCTDCHRDHSSGPGHDRASPQPCVLCHDPHLERNGPMLKASRDELCLGCHERAKLLNGPQTASIHQPVRNAPCDACHSPHEKGYPALLKGDPDALCLGCHKEVGYAAHREKPGQCVSCHRGHSSRGKSLTIEGSAAFCAGCHDKSYAQGSGHNVPAGGECFACHNPHERSSGKKVFQYCGRCHTLSDQSFAYTHGEMPFSSARQCLLCHQLHRPGEAPKTPALMYGPPHYPLRNGGCPVCHAVKDSKIAMRYEGNENCIRCHGRTVGSSATMEPEKVHAPIRQDDCIACHNPHYKDRPFMLLDEGDRVCEFCHGMVTRMGGNRHRALDEKSGCLTCHVPHFSEARPLLREEQRKLCLGCHGEMGKALGDEKAHGVFRRDECADCHTPHTTDGKHLLKLPPGELCLRCHPDAVKDSSGVPFPKLHGPVGANQCTACHYMGHLHREEGDKFLQEKPAWRVCLDCHDVTDEHVPSVYTFRLARNTGGCLGCHYPHGSKGSFMLRE